jgi:hypothetical protein
MRKVWVTADAFPTGSEVEQTARDHGAAEILHVDLNEAGAIIFPQWIVEAGLPLGYNEIAEPCDDVNFVEAEQKAELAKQAQDALIVSDLVALRCFKAGAAFPEAWHSYVVQLRDVIRGQSQALPAAPDFPAGA